MRFHNETKRHAKLLKNASPRGDAYMMGCVIARTVYAVKNGALQPLPVQDWPIGPRPEPTLLGDTPGDKPFYMGGVDVLIGGHTYAPQPAPSWSMELEIGRGFRRRIGVFGPRLWTEGPDGAPTPSHPASIRVQSLEYGHAFGGSYEEEGGTVLFGPNPRGVGFYGDRAAAMGQPLPSIEHERERIADPLDRPTPAGLGYYPTDGALRSLDAIDHPMAEEALARLCGPEARVKGRQPPTVSEDEREAATANHLTPRLFNQAHPNMIIDADKSPALGDTVRVTHARSDGSELSFALPDAPLHVVVQLQDRLCAYPLHLDQIGIICGAELVLLSHRVVFEYRVVREEQRHTSLYEGRPPKSIPESCKRKLPTPWEGGFWKAPPRPDE